MSKKHKKIKKPQIIQFPNGKKILVTEDPLRELSDDELDDAWQWFDNKQIYDIEENENGVHSIPRKSISLKTLKKKKKK